MIDSCTKDRILKIWMLAVLILLGTLMFAEQVESLGVAPSRKVVDYEPGVHTYQIRIINNENRQMLVAVHFQGEMAQYASIERNVISVRADEPEKTFSFEVDMPQDIEPGVAELDVMLLELADASSKTVSSNVQVTHQLRANVPYPGVFATGNLYITGGEVNDTLVFSANMINKGSNRIEKLMGEVVIYGPTNEEIKRIKSTAISSLEAGQSAKLVAEARADMNPGFYSAEFIVDYDGKVIVLRDVFRVGSMLLNIEDMHVDTFQLGTVARFDIDVLNKWNKPVSNIYADVVVLDGAGNQVGDLRTAPSDIKEYSRSTLVGYWDTSGVDVGTYDVRVILKYEDRQFEKLFKTIVGIDSIDVDGSSLSGNVITPVEKGVSLLYVLVGVSILLNAGLFIYFRAMRKKKDPPTSGSSPDGGSDPSGRNL